jgi:hypothetical protein
MTAQAPEPHFRRAGFGNEYRIMRERQPRTLELVFILLVIPIRKLMTCSTWSQRVDDIVKMASVIRNNLMRLSAAGKLCTVSKPEFQFFISVF